MSAAAVDKLRNERCTTVEGCDLKPLTSFAQTGLPAALLHCTRTFATPSPIQSQCWPIVLSGRDLVGIAATGSGKTLAFGLPCLRHVLAQKVRGRHYTPAVRSFCRGRGSVAAVLACD